MKKAATCTYPVNSAAGVCAALLATPPSRYAVIASGCLLLLVLSLLAVALLLKGAETKNKHQVKIQNTWSSNFRQNSSTALSPPAAVAMHDNANNR